MDIVLATQNRDKRRELTALLADLDLTVRSIDEFPFLLPIVEDGETCRDNARKKAVAVAKHTGLIAVADDTGLEVEALGGRPGVHAARYAGEDASYEDNCRKLLKELRDVGPSERGARFVTAVAICDPGQKIVDIVEGELLGSIAERPSGTQGFGYDPVFIVPQLGKTLAELSLDQKNQISHRAQALRKAKKILAEKLQNQTTVGA